MPRYAAQIGSTLAGLRRTHAADLGNVGRDYLRSRCDPLTEHRGETFWLFGNWVREQALLNGLHVVDIHPRVSLAERVLAAVP